MNAVWATFFHKVSTDDKPLHNMCSIEWCTYLKAEAARTLDSYKHKNPLPKAVMLAIKLVYSDLAHSRLLVKCLHGKTLNINETFSNVIWTRVPINVFVGRKTFEFGVHDAVVTFNVGNAGRLSILEDLRVKLGKNTVTILEDLDRLRIAKAEVAMQNMTKKLDPTGGGSVATGRSGGRC